MNGTDNKIQELWMEWCWTTERSHERFGLQNALKYLIGEKFAHFVWQSERDREYAAELAAFVAENRAALHSRRNPEVSPGPEESFRASGGFFCAESGRGKLNHRRNRVKKPFRRLAAVFDLTYHWLKTLTRAIRWLILSSVPAHVIAKDLTHWFGLPCSVLLNYSGQPDLSRPRQGRPSDGPAGRRSL
jgi:hypothetical protein